MLSSTEARNDASSISSSESHDTSIKSSLSEEQDIAEELDGLNNDHDSVVDSTKLAGQ